MTLGCGFCFPPCEGPKGERHPAGFAHGPCMLGRHGAPPPRSFGVSLVPIAEVPSPHRCGPHALCPPVRSAPPRRGVYRFLGMATPPPGGNDPEHGAVPRYSLDFQVPHLNPGIYVYVIWCGSCVKGDAGSLIADPQAGRWRLRVSGAGGVASARVHP